MKFLWATQKWNFFTLKSIFLQMDFKSKSKLFEFCKKCIIHIFVFWAPILQPPISTCQEILQWRHKNIGRNKRTWETGLVWTNFLVRTQKYLYFSCITPMVKVIAIFSQISEGHLVTLRLSSIGPSQYLDGWPLKKLKFFFFFHFFRSFLSF